MNLTTALEGEGGIRYCVAATWNHPELEPERLYALYGGVLDLLARKAGR